MIPSDTTINILGFEVTTQTRPELLRVMADWIIAREHCHHLMALNPIKVCRARNESSLAEHIRRADLVYPDAFGIAWAMKKFSGKTFLPIPGVELMFDLMQLANMYEFRVFLLGAAQGVIESAKTIFTKNYPSANIVGIRNGYLINESNTADVIDQVISSQPHIVLVGMGALIQENLIQQIATDSVARNQVIPLLMGVGGSFDAVTGHVHRPPQWMLHMHLEWLFRLVQQPLRAPRMIALPKFAMLVLGKKYLKLRLDYTFDNFENRFVTIPEKVKA